MKKGFTLIELLIVIAIIGTLSSVVLASITSQGVKKDKNYRICSQDEGRCLYVEAYTKEGNGTCVYMAEKETRMCGNYSIEKLTK